MLNDVRFAVRSFLKNPEFALACIVTLGLGIGANTAILAWWTPCCSGARRSPTPTGWR